MAIHAKRLGKSLIQICGDPCYHPPVQQVSNARVDR